MTKWNKIEDCLPRNDNKYLVYIKERSLNEYMYYVHCAFYRKSRGWSISFPAHDSWEIVEWSEFEQPIDRNNYETS
jgi:hypothetical protein